MKNPLHKILLFLCCLLLTSTAFTQKNFQPGLVVLNTGDTLKGLIDYRNWEINPLDISFMENGSNGVKIYSPAQIKTFVVSGEIYESAIVKKDNSPIATNLLSTQKELVLTTDTLFLQTLVKGNKSLYYHKNKAGIEHLFIGSGKGYEWLVYKLYLQESIPGENGIERNLEFRNQLINYLANCSEITNRINVVPYNKGAIEKIFKEYYKCSNSTALFEKTKENLKVDVGVLAGATISNLKFTGTLATTHYLVNSKYPASVNPVFGLFADFILPRNLGKISVYNELLYTSFNTSAEYTEYHSPEQYTIYKTDFAYTYLKANTMFRYKLLSKTIAVYIAGGMSNAVAIKQSHELQKDIKLYSSETQEKGIAVPKARSYEPGVVLGVTAGYKRYTFHTRLEQSNGMSIYPQLNSPISRIYLMLGYKL
jgi:hypothetical protein